MRPSHVIILAAMTLLAIGVLMVNSASMTLRAEGQPTGLSAILTSRPAIYMVLALTALAATALLPVRRILVTLGKPDQTSEDLTEDRDDFIGLKLLAIGTAAIVVFLLLSYVPGLAAPQKGASRWIRVPGTGGTTFQPSELAKWAMPALLAVVMVKRAHLSTSLRWGVGPIALSAGIVLAVIAKEDLGTAVLMASAIGIMLLASGASFLKLSALAPLALGGAALAVYLEPYRWRRLTTFWDPYADVEGAGFHVIQSMVTIAGAGPAGRGLGHGLQKFGYLPEDTTDFLLAVVCEEMGLAGAAVIVAAISAILLAGIKVLHKEPEPVCKLFALGVLATIGLQAAINIAVVTGWAPTKGIPLPLVSSGGSGWVLTCAALGVLVRMDMDSAAHEPHESELEMRTEAPQVAHA